jgi:hypothetical protein
MSKEEIQENEKAGFLEWRRSLAQFEEEEGLVLTPFERNLEMWRQLWRVVERSDVVVQVLDCRNPLLFRCPDFEDFIREVDPSKRNVLLLNKADLMSRDMREAWASYLRGLDIKFMFWSALRQQQMNDAKAAAVRAAQTDSAAEARIAAQSAALNPLLGGMPGTTGRGQGTESASPARASPHAVDALVGGGLHRSRREWYSKAASYWESIEATVNGVLGGFGHLTELDLRDSHVSIAAARIPHQT